MRVARFRMDGMSADYSDRLKSWVRNAWPRGPRYFSWSIASPSEPVAIELLLCLMAFTTCSVVKPDKVWSIGRSHKSWRFTRRAAGPEVWGTIVVNCLQKEVAILPSFVTCLLLKVIGQRRGITIVVALNLWCDVYILCRRHQRRRGGAAGVGRRLPGLRRWPPLRRDRRGPGAAATTMACEYCITVVSAALSLNMGHGKVYNGSIVCSSSVNFFIARSWLF